MKREWTENEIVEGCRRGDRAAQHELYVRTSDRVYRVLLKLTRDPEAAFDAAQESYLKAFARIMQFDGRSSLTTWLYRIAVNEALHAARRAGMAASANNAIGASETAEVTTEALSVRLDVEEGLAQLPEDDRAILVLRYHQGLNYAAIAAIAGVSEGTVASRLNRARQRLRDILRGYEAREETGLAAHPIDDGVETQGRSDRPGPRATSRAEAKEP